MRKRDKGRMKLERFLKMLARKTLPTTELMRDWFSQLSLEDEQFALDWMKTNKPELVEVFVKRRFQKFKDLRLEDTVVDVISGKHHTVQIALYGGYNKSIPIWLGQRQFRIFTSGKKQALPKGLYFPAWCLPEYIRALRTLYKANKEMINSLYRSAQKEIDF